MTREERYAVVIEDVLDILVENGNGGSTEDLRYAADLLFWARDGQVSWQRQDGSWYTSYQRPGE